MKLSGKHKILIAAGVVLLLVLFPFIDRYVMRPVDLEMKVVRALDYIKREKFDKAAEVFGFESEGEANPDRARSKEELIDRLKSMKEQGVRLSSFSKGNSYRKDGQLNADFYAFVTDGKAEYRCGLVFAGQTGGIVLVDIQGIKVKKDSLWEEYDIEGGLPGPVDVFVKAIDTYYPG